MPPEKPILDYEDPNRPVDPDEAQARLDRLTGRAALSFMWLFRVIAVLFMILFLTFLVLAIARSLQNR